MAGAFRRLRFRQAAWISGGDAEGLLAEAQSALRAATLGRAVVAPGEPEAMNRVRTQIVQNLVDAIGRVDDVAFPLGQGFLVLKATVDGRSSTHIGQIPKHITVDEKSVCDPRALLEQVLGDRVSWSPERLLEVEPSDEPSTSDGAEADSE